jgi:FlaG/FlaF family flagellin (archaellin)
MNSIVATVARAALIATVAIPAFASSNQLQPAPSASSEATAVQHQGQLQGQMQAQGQVGIVESTNVNLNAPDASATSSQAATTGASSSSLTVSSPAATTVRYEGGYTVRNTPDAPAVIASPTAPCRIAVGASLAIAGFAVGGGSSALDTGCDAREDARLLVNMGEFEAAISRLCAKPEMAAALAGRCPAKAAE